MIVVVIILGGGLFFFFFFFFFFFPLPPFPFLLPPLLDSFDLFVFALHFSLPPSLPLLCMSLVLLLCFCVRVID